jgi:hypothetical protein
MKPPTPRKVTPRVCGSRGYNRPTVFDRESGGAYRNSQYRSAQHRMGGSK